LGWGKGVSGVGRGVAQSLKEKPLPRGVVLWISSDGVDQVVEKSKPKKSPWGFQQNPKNPLDQKLTPQKSQYQISKPLKFPKSIK